MTKRELSNFSKWPLEDLVQRERSFPIGHRVGDEIRAEISRRVTNTDRQRAERSRRYALISVVIAVASALAGVVYGVDRGIYIGSSKIVSEGLLYKKCRYFFVTGVTEIPARGGVSDLAPSAEIPRGVQLADQPDNLYCRLFGE
jgi:hypothetical protein